MSEVVAEKTVGEEVVKGGELFCGCTSWDFIGRRKISPDVNLVSPTRLRPLIGVNAGCGRSFTSSKKVVEEVGPDGVVNLANGSMVIFIAKLDNKEQTR